jgi:hypothetical protein
MIGWVGEAALCDESAPVYEDDSLHGGLYVEWALTFAELTHDDAMRRS